MCEVRHIQRLHNVSLERAMLLHTQRTVLCCEDVVPATLLTDVALFGKANGNAAVLVDAELALLVMAGMGRT